MDSTNKESNSDKEIKIFQQFLAEVIGQVDDLSLNVQADISPDRTLESIQEAPNFDLTLTENTSLNKTNPERYSRIESAKTEVENSENTKVTQNISNPEKSLSTKNNYEIFEKEQNGDLGDSSVNELRNILVSEPLDELEIKIAEIYQKMTVIEKRINQDYLSNDRLVAFISKIISFRVANSQTIIHNALGPIIQTVIREKIIQNKQALSQAMIPAIADAVPQVIRQNSDEIAMGIAPKMAKAIEQQILLNQTATIETLSPIVDQVIQQNIAQTKNSDLQNILNSVVMPTVIQNLKEVRQDLIEDIIPNQIDTTLKEKNFIEIQNLENTLIPIIDRLLQKRIQQDKVSMSEALSPIIALAISKQITDSPDEIAKALSPEIAIAIKEKIKDDSLAMVDALYPVIGNTIVQYIAETIHEINQKLEKALSPEAIQRKIRAKIQGISEAELLLKEARPYNVQALFLIHNKSGLVIAEVQQEGKDRIESDMVAGMLTAIRSFVSEYMLDSKQDSQVQNIDYGNAQILIEVAGYCYLAVVVEGEPSKAFIKQIRRTLAKIIQNYGKQIASFKGKTATIPQEVHQLLQGLTRDRSKTHKQHPPLLLILALGSIGAIAITWGIISYRDTIDRQLAATTAEALISAPELSVYQLKVQVNRGKMTLTGRVPNQFLRQQAEQIATSATPTLELDNQIIPVQVPPDPVQTAAEVKRVQDILNELDNISIVASYETDRVTITGTIRQQFDAKIVTKAFAQIPGVKIVVNTLEIKPLTIDTRIYFPKNSAQLNPVDMNQKILRIEQFMTQHSQIKLKIVGYSDRRSDSNPDKLALRRAEMVKTALELQGINPDRLQVLAYPHPPIDVDPLQPLWLSRCVVFYPIASDINSQ